MINNDRRKKDKKSHLSKQGMFNFNVQNCKYMPGECSYIQCDAKNVEKRCPNCKVAYYCSAQHQKDDWKIHKKLCDVICWFNKLRCPISGTFFVNPIKNIECEHVYEKTAIYQMLKNSNGSCSCPHIDCKEGVRYTSLKYDPCFEKKMVDSIIALESTLKKSTKNTSRNYNGTLPAHVKIVSNNSYLFKIFKSKKDCNMEVRYFGDFNKVRIASAFFVSDNSLKIQALIDAFKKKCFKQKQLSDNAQIICKGRFIEDNSKTIEEIGVSTYSSFFVYNAAQNEFNMKKEIFSSNLLSMYIKNRERYDNSSRMLKESREDVEKHLVNLNKRNAFLREKINELKQKEKQKLNNA